QTTVQENQTSTADFIVANPGSIQGTVSVTGGTLNYGYIYASSGSGYSQTYFYGDGSGGGTFSLPVFPDASVYYYGYAYFMDGTYASITPESGLTVNAGDTLTRSYSFTDTPPPPPQTGTIKGTFSMPGPISPLNQYVYASGPGYGSAYVTADGTYQ